MAKKEAQKKADKRLSAKFRSEAAKLKKQFAKQLLKLVTSGFGLVAALAWNELIKEFINVYIQPIFGASSGMISLLIYAVFVTLLAVIVTYNLSRVVGNQKED